MKKLGGGAGVLAAAIAGEDVDSAYLAGENAAANNQASILAMEIILIGTVLGAIAADEASKQTSKEKKDVTSDNELSIMDKAIIGGKLFDILLQDKAEDLDNTQSTPLLPDFNDALNPPEGFEWRGKPGSKPGAGEGNYYNPETGESLRPDLDHAEPIGPHWDYKDENGDWHRIKEDGTKIPKK